jgi:multidrug resistance efflux pump
MAMTLSGALAPLAKVQKNLEKFVNQAQARISANDAELVSAKETYETTERRLTSANVTINAELDQATAVIENLSKLLGK